MRKRLKKKLRSCPLCKPHKTKGACRWKPKEEAKLNEFERKKPEDWVEDYKNSERGCD